MKKFLPLIIIVILAIFVPSAFAASLEVSRNANFSSEDLNFNGGEKVYIRLDSDVSGSSQKVLNIRDNQYNLVSSVDLLKSGNQFTASFSVPNSQGYFSLEAVIEGDGDSSKSVKTIKVGNPSSASIKVNVNSSVKGEKSTNWTNGSNEGLGQTEEDQAGIVSPTPEVYKSNNNSADIEKPQKSFWLFTLFKNIFSFFWPFK